MPGVYSLSGGAMWNNKSDNILCPHRPNYADQTDPTVHLSSKKIKKQKLNGIPGTVELTFDRRKNRYYSDSPEIVASENANKSDSDLLPSSIKRIAEGEDE